MYYAAIGNLRNRTWGTPDGGFMTQLTIKNLPRYSKYYYLHS